jgi:probable phosphoglycerate mutase
MPRLLAPILAKVTFARVFTSPLQRAREICELAVLGTRAEIDHDLVDGTMAAMKA